MVWIFNLQIEIWYKECNSKQTALSKCSRRYRRKRCTTSIEIFSLLWSRVTRPIYWLFVIYKRGYCYQTRESISSTNAKAINNEAFVTYKTYKIIFLIFIFLIEGYKQYLFKKYKQYLEIIIIQIIHKIFEIKLIKQMIYKTIFIKLLLNRYKIY